MPNSTVILFQCSHSSDSYQVFVFFLSSSERWELVFLLIAREWGKIKNSSLGFCLTLASLLGHHGPLFCSVSVFLPVNRRLGRDGLSKTLL